MAGNPFLFEYLHEEQKSIDVRGAGGEGAPRSADIPVCGFTGLSSSVFPKYPFLAPLYPPSHWSHLSYGVSTGEPWPARPEEFPQIVRIAISAKCANSATSATFVFLHQIAELHCPTTLYRFMHQTLTQKRKKEPEPRRQIDHLKNPPPAEAGAPPHLTNL